MASNNNSRNASQAPGAQSVLDKYKMEAANEVGVSLKDGYNGDLTTKQAGSIGGRMVKKMIESSDIGSFKNEAVSAAGVTLKPGYNGDLTAKQAGSIGGNMVKRAIETVENGSR